MSQSNKYDNDLISAVLNDNKTVTAALQRGINAGLLLHKKLGYPIVVSRNGVVTWIAPEDILIPEDIVMPEIQDKKNRLPEEVKR